MRFERTKRAISAILAILFVAASTGARSSNCLCTDCDYNSDCCRSTSCESTGGSCCSTAEPKACGCCSTEHAAPTSTGSSAAAPVVPRGCQCVTSAPSNVVPLTRPVVVDQHELVALAPKQFEIADDLRLSFLNVEVANRLADSHPPFRILYCAWIE
ncbi:MAG: hypothetical protein AB7O26_13500 [Planctomycetaceae bacterium]